MPVEVKICGTAAPAALAAAIAGGADYIGLNFYPPSPRYLRPDKARAMVQNAPARMVKVGLFVDAEDATIAALLEVVPLDLLQLHGAESPKRVKGIRDRFGLPVMKAVGISGTADIAAAEAYGPVVDRLLFDAKPPKDMKGALPGGNALAFDWTLLAGRYWPVPMGTIAMDLLLDRMQGFDGPTRERVLPTEMIVRRSSLAAAS